MRELLAERLLTRVMGWDSEDVARERPLLQAMAVMKYDDYQQFSPGMRFIESLAVWLSQFTELAERRVAYALFKDRLIFISTVEMGHLASSAYPELIRPQLIDSAASDVGVRNYRVTHLIQTLAFRLRRRQSLFLGLSDGARLDVFRRANPEISHEQISQVYLLAAAKLEDLKDKLIKDLTQILGRVPTSEETKFRSLYLIDDFSASGTSYCRKERSGEFKGKIIGALKQLESFGGLIDIQDVSVNIVIYVATGVARKRIQDRLDEWNMSTASSATISVHVMQTITEAERVDVPEGSALDSLLKKYFDEEIVDEHYTKGAHAKPYLGFDENALPLIMAHNTPNNSLPILWFDSTLSTIGLFPRVRRHKEAHEGA